MNSKSNQAWHRQWQFGCLWWSRHSGMCQQLLLQCCRRTTGVHGPHTLHNTMNKVEQMYKLHCIMAAA